MLPHKQYPTRLLDLRNVSQDDTLVIIDLPIDFEGEYVTLSYCWGSQYLEWIDYVRGRQLNSPRRTVEMKQMPRTLQDAVTCCIKLDYRYIWIDCLCILQGNRADWLSESAKMADTYANSALTISASDSKDCRDGFLIDRSALQLEGAVLELLADDNGTKGQIHLSLPDTDFPSLVGGGPVAQRGWCLQERQLSSRVLHVCRSQIFFECPRCRRFESEVTPADEFDLNNEFNVFHMPSEAHGSSRGKPSATVQNIFSWYAIIEDYTRRALTVPRDKLVAIAGLARRAHQTLKGEYLAGLWSTQLHVGLLWMIDEHASAMRAPNYRAPSWSWASMDGPVSWTLIDGYVQSDDGFVESAIELLASSIQLDSGDPFGPVQRVEIVVSGRLKQVPSLNLLHNKLLTYPAWMAGAGVSTFVGWYFEDEKRIVEDSQVTCLKIATRPFGPGPSLPPTNEMIILEKVEGGNQEADTYRRIGFGQVLVTDYFDDDVVQKLTLI